MSAVEKQGEYQPEIVVLYCRNCLTPGIDPPSGVLAAGGIVAKYVPMPCSSKVEPSHLMKILERGADGVEVVGCPDGQCGFLDGNRRADKRVTRLRSLLAEIKLGEERLCMNRGTRLTSEALFALAQKRARAVAGLGPNPMKGVNR
ncbi:MAG: hydrogenase iron-sulfur subunit [Deltaproteobacteria bacterium]|nr:hydrogenase iron-sulfur subunit [Deltaproteobacteria bacterium]